MTLPEYPIITSTTRTAALVAALLALASTNIERKTK